MTHPLLCFLWECRTHYAAILLNIAVQGANISSSPILTNSTGAELQVIFDSGTTLAYLVEPFYTEFMTAVNFSFFHSFALHTLEVLLLGGSNFGDFSPR